MPVCPDCGKQLEENANFCSRCGARIIRDAPAGEPPNPSVEGLIADIRKKLRDAPDDPDLHYNLALAYRLQGSFDLAIQEMNVVVRLSPDFAEACYQLGLLHRHIGDIEKAREAFRQAASLDLDSKYTAALESLS